MAASKRLSVFAWHPTPSECRQEFERQRKEHVDTLANLAIDNFLEMRDRVSSRWFLWQKKLQILLHKLFPRWYVPLYTLVSFTTTPYAAARRRALQQERVVRWICVGLLSLVLLAVAALVWWWRS